MTHEEAVERLVECEQRSKSNKHRLDKLEKDSESLHKLATSVEVLAKNQDRFDAKLDKIDTKVENLEQKPARRLESIIGYILAALSSGVVGYLISHLF